MLATIQIEQCKKCHNASLVLGKCYIDTLRTACTFCMCKHKTQRSKFNCRIKIFTAIGAAGKRNTASVFPRAQYVATKTETKEKMDASRFNTTS